MKKPGFGFLALGSYPPAAWVDMVKSTERSGFETLWAADERFWRDCWAQLAVASQHSTRLSLGTAVTDPYIRHPALTAIAISTIHELSGGRAILGLGMGGSGFQALGLKKERPLTVLRESIELIRALLAGQEVDYQGQVVKFKGRLNTAPAPTLPIMIATNGVQVMELAGGIADLVMVQGLGSTQMLEAVLERVDAGARRAGRPRPRIVARLDTVIADDHADVRRATLPGIVRHLRVHSPEFKSQALAGLKVDDRLREAVSRLTYTFDLAIAEQVAQLIPDEFIERLCLAGSVSTVEAQVRRLSAAGVDHFTVFPVAAKVDPATQARTVAAFADGVIPKFA